MKKQILVIIAILFTTSCTSMAAGNTNGITESIVTDPNQRYELERVSFLPPKGEGWQVTKYEKRGTLRFRKNFHSKTAAGYYSLDIAPFNGSLESFAEALQREKIRVEKYNNGFKHLGNNPARPYESVTVVTKAGMRCIKSEDVGSTAIAGALYSVSYYCEQPNQPKDIPLLSISSSFPNSDEILEPIWKSIRFKPVDRTSQVYLHWKEENEKIRKIRNRDN